MKNKFTTHLIAILAIAFSFIGCSKDDSLQPNSSTSLAATGKMAPVEDGGTVIGTLSPEPVTSDISLRQGDWLTVGQTTADKGSFMIGYIPEGTYYLQIRYTLSAGEPERVKRIEGIVIRLRETINLGTITLD